MRDHDTVSTNPAIRGAAASGADRTRAVALRPPGQATADSGVRGAEPCPLTTRPRNPTAD